MKGHNHGSIDNVQINTCISGYWPDCLAAGRRPERRLPARREDLHDYRYQIRIRLGADKAGGGLSGVLFRVRCRLERYRLHMRIHFHGTELRLRQLRGASCLGNLYQQCGLSPPTDPDGPRPLQDLLSASATCTGIFSQFSLNSRRQPQDNDTSRLDSKAWFLRTWSSRFDEPPEQHFLAAASTLDNVAYELKRIPGAKKGQGHPALSDDEKNGRGDETCRNADQVQPEVRRIMVTLEPVGKRVLHVRRGRRLCGQSMI